MNPTSTLTPQQRVEAWLADFEAALAVRDIDRATQKFATDSFWRDLVAFTWNIKTVEGRDGIADMLTSQLAHTDPSNFRTREDVTEDAGVVSAFIEFDTAVGRGVGHLRLKGDEAWTLLTALQELKGHEQREGPSRVLGAVHGCDPDTRGRGRRSARTRKPTSATRLSRTRSSSAAGKAGSRSARGFANWGCLASSSTDTNDLATSGASATSRCACTTPSGTTTCPTSHFLQTGRCSHPRTRSATGWSSTPG